MTYIDSAHFFFISVIIGIVIGIITNLLVQDLLLFQEINRKKKNEEISINDVKNRLRLSIFLLLLVLGSFFIFAIGSAPSSVNLLNIEQNPTSTPSNITLNQINNYYNISSINVTYNYSNNLDIVEILNSYNPKLR